MIQLTQAREPEPWIQELLHAYDEDEKMTEKQKRIVTAAVEVFAEKGYSASSTSEIAQKAGVAEGTIFRHYKTKKDLLMSIVSPLMVKLLAPFFLRDFTKVLDAAYPRYEDFLRAVIRNRVAFVQSHFPLVKIMLQEIPFQPELREQLKGIVAKEVLVRIQRVVERYQSDGQISSTIPSLSVVRVTATTVIGFVIARYLLAPEHKWDDEAELETTVQFIMKGLSAGQP